VVVRYGRGNWPGLTVRQLFGETLVPAASRELAGRLGADPSAEYLARFPLLHDSDSSQWRAWFAAAGLRYRPRADDRRFEDYDLVLAAAEGSLGLALLRQPLAQGWLDDGRLVPVSAQLRPNPLGHYVAHRREERRESVLAVVDALCRAAGTAGIGGEANKR
jgi:DNA-binding transcriptional LysR family regulator